MTSEMSWPQQCAHEAGLLTKEVRQKFLDLMHAGKTLGDAGAECGISLAASCGIMHENIDQRVHKTLRTEAVR